MGLLSYLRVPPNDTQASRALGPGRWALHTTSTVPFVELRGGKVPRIITWSDTIEIKEQAQVVNVSAHLGDIHLAEVSGQVTPPWRPPQYTIPAVFTDQDDGTTLSNWLDVTNARRAYLTVNVLAPASFPLPVTIEHVNKALEVGIASGLQLAPGSTATTQAGLIFETRAVGPVLDRLALGLLALAAPNGGPEPHQLFRAVRVRAPTPWAGTGLDTFFAVEF